MSNVVQLFILKNGALEGTEMVSGERFVVGRDPGCAVVLDDPSIAARHLGIFVHDGKLAVQDLGGAGGTRVNGELIVGPRYIGPREDVAVGVFTIKLKLMGAVAVRSSVAPTPAAPAAVSATPQQAPSAPAAAVAPTAKAVVPTLPLTPVLAAKGTVPAPSPAFPPRAAQAPEPVTAVSPDHTGVEPFSEATQPKDSPPPVAGTHRPGIGVSPLGATNAALEPPPPRAQHVLGPQAVAAVAEVNQAREPAVPLHVWGAAAESGPLTFRPGSDDDDDAAAADDDVPWSLVQRLVRPPAGAAGKNAVIEVVHYRGEHVVDHKVIAGGGKFVLGSGWSERELRDRGLERPVPLVRFKKDGVAEILQSAAMQGKLWRQGVEAELPTTGAAAPLFDGELCSLRIGTEHVFVRFAGVPALLWSRENIDAANAQRRLTIVSTAASVAFFAFFVLLSWVYGYRTKSEDIIDLEDDGFAEKIEKDLSFVEPPKPQKPPEPVKTAEPVSEKQPVPKIPPAQKSDPVPEAPVIEAPKPGAAAALLANISKVNEPARNQNLTAALSNIKAVRVPGDAASFKTSAFTGKGPSSGVQIGGATGGLATSGINKLLRNDGAAGSLGGKGDRQVGGKVTTQPRLSQIKGKGELSKDEIQKVINSHVGEIQYCYEKQLRTNAGLAGRVVLEWTVSTSGGVSVVKVATSTLASTDATKCMMDKVKTWKFPKPRGSGAVTVVYPFVFNTI